MVSRKGKTRRKRTSAQRSSSSIEMDISNVKEIQRLLQWKEMQDEAWANTMGLLGLFHVKWASPRRSCWSSPLILGSRPRTAGSKPSREGWVVSWMKKPYAQRYAAILQVIYLWRRHTYFSNKAAVTLCRAEHKKPVNWCLIMLQCLGVELHRWDNNYGGDVFVAGLVVDILLKKRIPLEDKPDNVTLELVEEEEEKEVEAEMENSPETLCELFMREKRAPPTINTSPLFSRSQQLQSKNKSVRPRTTDASPVFVRRSLRFQSQSKPVSPSQEVADKELPGRNCPRTQSPSRKYQPGETSN
ncbi:unnamed protein product [Sphagnum balticum]